MNAELALRSADSKEALEDAWFDHCDELADDDPERKRLLEVYMDTLARLKAEQWAELLRA